MGPSEETFHLLHRNGRELTGRPLRERRSRLEDIVADADLVLPVRRLASNGFEAWAEVIARDCEGYVAKDETSLSPERRAEIARKTARARWGRPKK